MKKSCFPWHFYSVRCCSPPSRRTTRPTTPPGQTAVIKGVDLVPGISLRTLMVVSPGLNYSIRRMRESREWRSQLFTLFADPETVIITYPQTGHKPSDECRGNVQLSLGANWASGNSPGGNRGFNLYSGGVSGTQLINLNHGNSDTITLDGSPMLEEYGNQAMLISITYTNPTMLAVAATGRNGIESFNELSRSREHRMRFAFTLPAWKIILSIEKPYFDEFAVIPETRRGPPLHHRTGFHLLSANEFGIGELDVARFSKQNLGWSSVVPSVPEGKLRAT